MDQGRVKVLFVFEIVQGFGWGYCFGFGFLRSADVEVSLMLFGLMGLVGSLINPHGLHMVGLLLFFICPKSLNFLPCTFQRLAL